MSQLVHFLAKSPHSDLTESSHSIIGMLSDMTGDWPIVFRCTGIFRNVHGDRNMLFHGVFADTGGALCSDWLAQEKSQLVSMTWVAGKKMDAAHF